MWKNAVEFFGNVTENDYKRINNEKAQWYKERYFMDESTKMCDFYKDAVKQELIKEKENNINADYFKSLLIGFMRG